jgi:hypothetical protein
MIQGWCMDVFHPRFADDFLYPILLKNMQEYYQGYWLEKNTPEIKRVVDPKFVKLFDIPFRPGKSNSNNTIPENAKHNLGEETSFEHYYLHALYGSKMTT